MDVWQAWFQISASTCKAVLGTYTGSEHDYQQIYIIILDPDERRPTTVRSNDTLVDTPFQLISGFFHVNQGVLCCWTSFLQGCVEGGSNRLAK